MTAKAPSSNVQGVPYQFEARVVLSHCVCNNAQSCCNTHTLLTLKNALNERSRLESCSFALGATALTLLGQEPCDAFDAKAESILTMLLHTCTLAALASKHGLHSTASEVSAELTLLSCNEFLARCAVGGTRLRLLVKASDDGCDQLAPMENFCKCWGFVGLGCQDDIGIKCLQEMH